MNQFINQQKKKNKFVIQRLVIYHQGFVCKDESATIEELSEHILYYFDIKYHLSSYSSSYPFNHDHQHNHHDNMRDIWSIHLNHDSISSDKEVINDDNSEKVKEIEQMKLLIRNEAVQFVGMCETLQDFTVSMSTNSSLTPDTNDKLDDSFIEQVHLSDSTLIYIQLEKQCYAVAEVPRRIAFEFHNPCHFCNMPDNKRNFQDLNDIPQKSLNQQQKIQSNTNSFLGWKKMFWNEKQTDTKEILNTKQDGNHSQSHLEYNHHPLCTNQNKFEAADGDPDWIRDSIKTCHLLFCMLDGKGGILYRIGTGTNNSENGEHYLRHNDEDNGISTNHNDDCSITGNDYDYTSNDNGNDDCSNTVYHDANSLETNDTYASHQKSNIPMDTIRKLRKNLRKTELSLKSHLHTISIYEQENNIPHDESKEFKNSESYISLLNLRHKKQDIMNEIEEIRNKMMKLLPTIPITSLRQDLQLHYDKILQYMLFPSPPISTSPSKQHILTGKSNGKISSTYPHHQLDLEITGTMMIGRLMDELLSTFGHKGLVAVSAFHQRKLSWTQDNIQTKSAINDIFISRKETVVLYEYIKNYQKPQTLQQQMKSLLNKKKNKLVSSSTPTKKTNMKNEIKKSPSRTKFASSAVQNSKSKILPFFIKENLGYYASPPTIKKRSDKNLNSETEQQIWLLDLCLCKKYDGERCNYIVGQGCHSVESIHCLQNYQVLCFSSLVFDFLLYFETKTFPSDKKHDLRIIPSRIEFDEVTKQNNIESNKNQSLLLGSTGDNLPSNGKQIPSIFFAKIADYISKEIKKYDERIQRQYNTRKEKKLIQNISNFNGETGIEILYADHREQNVVIRSQKFNLHGNTNQFQPLFWNYDSYPNFLATHLSDDVIMALNDTLLQIQTINNRNSNDHLSEMREICTLLPSMWIYGVSHDRQELLIIFDAKKFATIGDVQKSAHRVRNEMFSQVFL